jgi:DNA-binding transcriptional LysR family regulator
MPGDPLFVPSRNGMTPTPLAPVLAQLRAVVTSARAFDPARDEFTVHVAAPGCVQSALLLDFTLALRREAPGLRIALRPADAARLAAQMEQGEVDVAMLMPDGIAARRQFRDAGG